ncbi:ribonuclease HII [Patescibacteria group bacterium]|nr:ribonuclease HII [Patescibacteria group bacterium]MCL5409582.1 ribonuclease HII [Patescibacteria group bacterium]
MVWPSLAEENKLFSKGYQLVCGLDEVGRGCFAGPVVVGAVVINSKVVFPTGVADSKMVKTEMRVVLAQQIKQVALDWAVGVISVQEINKHGIGTATQMAFRKALKNLKLKPDYCLIDAFSIKHLNHNKQLAVPQGDSLCSSIAAASIVAKVYRDDLMEKLHLQYPEYGFAQHKGYGTKQHQTALKKYGLCKIHRLSFNLERFLS